MICNTNYLADIFRVCEIKDLIWVMRFQSPLVYDVNFTLKSHFCCKNVIIDKKDNNNFPDFVSVYLNVFDH